MKRILSLDGGGIRGLFSLQVLAQIEKLLREKKQQPNLVLADEFDMFAGTSTGAIIAAGLCWGMSIAEIEQLYLDHGAQMFTRSPWFRRWKAKFRSDKLEELFRSTFCEDTQGKVPALLGTAKLRKLLLAVVRNASTGAPWPLTNNPHAQFNDRALADCNLDIPLWQLLRASTAAPSFFAPERIVLGTQAFLFVDGAITPYNNPALIAVLSATLPCYRVGWSASREDLHVVSIGTGTTRARLKKLLPQKVNLLDHLHYVPIALVGASALQQDMLCRVLGDCVYGAPIDLDAGDLCEPSLLASSEQKFTYVRYDTRLDQCKEMSLLPPAMQASIDNLKLIPTLQQIGRDYATQNVRLAHLYPRDSLALAQ
jgi:hypothetical protein